MDRQGANLSTLTDKVWPYALMLRDVPTLHLTFYTASAESYEAHEPVGVCSPLRSRHLHRFTDQVGCRPIPHIEARRVGLHP